MEIHSDIKDMKTWEEASLWLARHGWGDALIAEQKQAWDWVADQKPKSKPTPKPVQIKSIKKDK